MDIFQLIMLILLIFSVFLAFKGMRTSFKTGKPYRWQYAVKNKLVSRELISLERSYDDKVQFHTFWLQIERILKDNIPGDFAELGVYKGSSAKIIHHMAPSRILHLFDTFKGFDESDLAMETEADNRYTTQSYSDTSAVTAKMYIGGNENVLFHPGNFPASIESLDIDSFAFVHIDSDLYRPTLKGLHYFYSKLSPGGVIIVHDYNHNWESLRKAVDEFTATIKENIIELPDTYGSVMILKN